MYNRVWCFLNHGRFEKCRISVGVLNLIINSQIKPVFLNSYINNLILTDFSLKSKLQFVPLLTDNGLPRFHRWFGFKDQSIANYLDYCEGHSFFLWIKAASADVSDLVLIVKPAHTRSTKPIYKVSESKIINYDAFQWILNSK